VVDYYVDPANGNDSRSGLSRANAKRTVSSIWQEIPQNSPLTTGVRINLLPGIYTSDHLPNYWENRVGTFQAPIIIQAADGSGTVFLNRDINMAGVSYFYLLGVDIKNQLTDGYGDAFHCERCDHILLRGNSFNGAPNGLGMGDSVAHETIKFNQSQYIYIENNNIQGADDNAIDWVAVQYGHIRANRIHEADGWCTYVKGGSSYVLIESNKFYNCGEGGVTAGQGTGFEFMVNPFLRFEANYIKIVNNVISDVEGAALGINGGYGILVAHNTAYRVGARSHLVEVVFGERSCDGDSSACAARRTLGGWGPALTGFENTQPIGNRDVVIANNILFNPSGSESGSQHFAIYGPRTPNASGIPSPQKTDEGLKIFGNVISNGDNSMPLGVEESSEGCRDSNTTCNQAQLLADNIINQFQPQLNNAASGDFRPLSGGNISSLLSDSIADLPAIDSTLNPITEGVRGNNPTREFSGAAVSVTARPPGAFARATSLDSFPSDEDSDMETPEDDINQPPSITVKKLTSRKNRRKATTEINLIASDSDGISSVKSSIRASGLASRTISIPKKGSRYTKRFSLTFKKRYSLVITAMDNRGASSQVSRRVSTR